MGLAWAAEAANAAGTRDGSGYWQLALVVAAIGFLGLLSRWRKAAAKPLTAARELRERDSDPNRYRDAADRAIVELLETSRTLNAQVDTKIRVLNRLVKDAMEQAERLENLLAAAKDLDAGGRAAGPRGGPEAGVPESSGVKAASDRQAGNASARRRSETTVGVAFSGPGGGAGASESDTIVVDEPQFMSELHERIYRLRQSGKNVAEIAKATNLSTTEVEFIVHTLIKGA